MIFDGELAVFKSSPSFYELERDGLKRNTVRLLETHMLQALLDRWHANPQMRIRIQALGVSEDFERFITDISDITHVLALITPPGKRLVVISWGRA